MEERVKVELVKVEFVEERESRVGESEKRETKGGMGGIYTFPGSAGGRVNRAFVRGRAGEKKGGYGVIGVVPQQ
jgi:hypothetical protein